MKGTILLFHLALSSKPDTIQQQDEDKNLEDFLIIQERHGPASVSLSLSAIRGKHTHDLFHKQKFMKPCVNYIKISALSDEYFCYFNWKPVPLHLSSHCHTLSFNFQLNFNYGPCALICFCYHLSWTINFSWTFPATSTRPTKFYLGLKISVLLKVLLKLE